MVIPSVWSEVRRCRLAYGPADATTTDLSLPSVKSRLVLPHLGSPGKRAVKRVCVCVCVCVLCILYAKLFCLWRFAVPVFVRLSPKLQQRCRYCGSVRVCEGIRTEAK